MDFTSASHPASDPEFPEPADPEFSDAEPGPTRSEDSDSQAIPAMGTDSGAVTRPQRPGDVTHPESTPPRHRPGRLHRRARRRFRAFVSATGIDARHLGEVLRDNTVGGLIMLGATVLALVWANVGSVSYQAVSQTHLGPLTVAHWASDGLLTVFFFVAGLELKRELTEGSLRQPFDALVPIVAAVFGMAVPALVYVAANVGLPGLTRQPGNVEGWAIPMATDIAFALAVLAITGSNMPSSLRAFLLTLAIVDDLGAILVIAVVFTGALQWGWLIGAVALIGLWGLGQHLRFDNGWWYIPLGVAAWWCMLQSGVHATIAGVALGLLTRNTRANVNEPLDRWQHRVEPISAGAAVPLFALFAAGVPVDGQLLGRVVSTPVPLGIILGLLIGKPVGVLAGSWLTVHFTRAHLGRGLYRRDMVAAGQLTGIGFTVSLLICELAFRDKPELLDEAKIAVLLGSAASALLGGLAMAVRDRRHRLAFQNNVTP